MAVSFYLKSAINLQDSTPVFNKRLFKAQAGIVLTEEILAILKRPLSEERSKPDLHKLKSVVNGLKDIHKDLQFIKDALCYVVGYEKVGSNIQVKKQSTETDLSCYYILNGSIEATYVIGNGDQDERTKMKTGFESFQFQRRGLTDCKRSDGYEIKYTHIAGDYLGLVSGDGPEYDLPPPYSIRTTEVCEFLRIDRTKFHQAVRKIHSHHVQEIEHFINSGSILRDLPFEERQRLVSLMARQEYAAGKVIVNQGDFPDHIFFVGKGRCQFFRRVFIKEARRLELVKLGHIEQGDVFGESSVLDGSPCFCSVSTIGQVTCYLINKWAIKHNEHVLNLLREHEHHFFEDCTIQHYIRDSDVWQSYKRSKINELLETTSKRHIIIEKKHVPEPLALVVEFGDAKRSHSSQSLREREPGEPESKQPLFVVPRSRRKSSAILQSNAAAVVKAVLLLRRNAEDSSKEPLRLPKFKTHEPRQQSRVKPRSAPGRYRSFNDTSYSQDESNISVKCDNRNNQCRKTSSSDLDKQSKKKQQSAVENGRRSKSVNEMHLTGRGVTNACPSLTKRQTPSESRRVTPSGNNQRKGEKSTKKVTMSQTISTTSQKSKDQGNDFIQNEEKHRASGSGMEKFVSTSGNFIVKKIINTGNPKRLPSSQGYQRFGISMFAILDDEKAIENNRQLGPNPWGVSYAASKWMSGIRKKRLSMLNKRDQVSSPVPTPLIVIEEYAPEKSRQQSDEEGISTDSDCSSEDVEVHSDKYSIHTKKTSRRSKGTPSPSLEQLKEEDEEDIKEYDKHAAGNAVEESWYTPIHKARDQSHSCLEQLRKELEALQCSPNERRRRRHGGSCEKESTAAFDDQLVNDVQKDDIENQSKDESEATEDSPQSSANQRHRQRKYSTRKRSRTHSTSTVSDTQTLDEGSPRRSDSPRIRKRFSNQIRNFTSDQGLAQPQEFILAEEVRNNEKKTEKTTKHERRRLLLLEKIGL